MRVCTRCSASLDLSCFGKSKNGPDGLNYWCKSCVRQNAAAHRARLVAELGHDGYLAQRRAYYAKRHDQIQSARAIRQEIRRDHFTEQSLAWQRAHKPKVAASKKKHRAKHQDKILAYTRDYHANHRNERNERVRRRKRTDPVFKLRERLRSTFADKLRLAIRRMPHDRPTSTKSVLALIGCSLTELMGHLERQFLPGMSWANWGRSRGSWHIDHIRPISSFDLLDDKDLQECWHFTNLKPLWAEDNLKKGRHWHPKGEA